MVSTYSIETPDGYLLTHYDPKVAAWIEAGRESMKDNRDVFKALATQGPGDVKRAPKWIDKRALLLLHEESLAMFGGARGMRDEGLLDSALARPFNQFFYEKADSLAGLAAAYGYAIAKKNAFVDGNRRAAFLAIGLFLAINRKPLRADPVDAIQTILALAAGSLDAAALANWIAANLRSN